MTPAFARFEAAQGHRALSAARALLVVLVVSAVAACRPSPDAALPATASQAAPPGSSAAAASSAAAEPLPPPPVAPLSPGARTEDEQNTIAVFRDVAPSTVFVTQTRLVVDWYAGVTQEVPAGSGSGFVWDDEGHIVTNYHVVEGARSLTVTFQAQKTFQARVVGVEPTKDIAVLQVTAPPELLKPIRVSAHGDLDVGQKTIAIGNPFGLDHTLTTGVVSALGRQVQGIGGVTIRDMVQTDAAINPGNSGGPLLDSSGKLIGMNTMIFSKSGSSAGIGFAVPAATIARIVPQIIKHGRAETVGIGVEVDPNQRIERRLGIRGVVVISVRPGGPAERAGLQGLRVEPDGVVLGDIIVAIDDVKVGSFDDFYGALDGRSAGDEITAHVLRERAVVHLPMELVLVQ